MMIRLADVLKSWNVVLQFEFMVLRHLLAHPLALLLALYMYRVTTVAANDHYGQI